MTDLFQINVMAQSGAASGTAKPSSKPTPTPTPVVAQPETPVAGSVETTALILLLGVAILGCGVWLRIKKA